MTLELQLADYFNGYRFRLQCRQCGNGWHKDPSDLLHYPMLHTRMYLNEIEQVLPCRACHKMAVRITPLIIKPAHHFVGGLG